MMLRATLLVEITDTQGASTHCVVYMEKCLSSRRGACGEMWQKFPYCNEGEKRKKPFTKANCICVKYGPTGGFLFPVGPGLTETLSLSLKQDVKRTDMYFLHRLVSIEIYLNMCSV